MGPHAKATPERVLAYLKNSDRKLSCAEIASGVGISKKQATSALQSLRDRKAVTSKGLKKSAVWGVAIDPMKIIAGLVNRSAPQCGFIVEHSRLRAVKP